MDYKFRISAFQHAGGDENAKIKISIGDTVLVAEAEVSSTSVDSPTEITFDVTGLDSVGDGVSTDIKIEMINDYYVDSDTFRRVTIPYIHYIYKDAAAATYTIPVKTWIGGSESNVDLEWQDTLNLPGPGEPACLPWIKSIFSFTAGDYQGDWTAGQYAIIYNDYVTLNAPLTTSWLEHWQVFYGVGVKEDDNGRLEIAKAKYETIIA